MSVVANVAINVDSRNAITKLRQVQTQAASTEKAFSGITAAVGKLAVAFAGIQAIKFVFAKSAELESQARSLQVLTGSAQKAGQIIKELQQLGAVTPFTSTELIDSAKRLQAFGVEADKVVETTRRLADVSGATGAELSGLVTAYGQVQAKGRLQGEELLQFQERGVALQVELRKMYGLSGEEFQKALAKGRIGAEAVEVAVKRLTEAGGKYANGAIAQSDTLNGKLSTLQDSFEQLARNIGTFFAPVFKFLIDGINAFLDRVNNGLRVSAQLKANEQAATRTRNKFGLVRQINPFDKETQEYEARLQRSIFKSLTSQGGAGGAPSAPTPTAVPALLGATTGGGGRAGGGGANDAQRAAEVAAKLEQQTQERLRSLTRETELIGQITNLKELQAAADAAGDKELQARLTGEEQIINIIQRTAQELDGVTDKRLRQAIIGKAETEIGQVRVGTALELQRIENERTKNFEEIIADLDFELKLKQATTAEAREQLRLENELRKLKGQGFPDEQIGQITGKQAQLAAPDTAAQTIEKRIGTLNDEVAELTNIGNIAITVADGIGVAFSQAFQGLISGSMSAQEALGSFFKSVGDMFISMATEIIAKQMTMIILQTILKALGAVGGGGGFSGNAAGFGGSFDAGIPSIGNTTSFAGVFGRASGGPATGGAPYLVGERGPELFVPGTNGGVMSNNDLRNAMGSASGSGGGAPVLNMSFETTQINGVEYVSREQLELAMAQTRRQASRDGAQRGMSMTLDKIQNSPQTRSRIGVR